MTTEQNKWPPAYTKGPWKCSAIDVRHPSVNRPFAVIETHDGMHRIANIQSDLDDDVCIANAQLIAAAPELLEALEVARNGLQWFIDDNGGGNEADYEALKQIDAAIGKATGGAA
jgi:hypothetical protein